MKMYLSASDNLEYFRVNGSVTEYKCFRKYYSDMGFGHIIQTGLNSFCSQQHLSKHAFIICKGNWQ
jgi:hypothetical protein